MIQKTDIEFLSNLLADVAKSGIMPHFQRLDREGILAKTNASDLVTIADVAAEKAITKTLQETYPNANIIGEEAVSENPNLLDNYDWQGLTFVIDPIDGTFNFASGIPLFGVMLAIVQDGETIAGIIHDPVMGDWILAEKGAGAFCRRADGSLVPLQVADPVSFEQMTGSLSWAKMPMALRQTMLSNQARCLNFMGYRCAAHDYRALTSPNVHFTLYKTTMPWDHLAGTLIHQEAGGYSATFDGSAYKPHHVNDGLLCATDQDSWQELRRELWA